MKALAFSLLTIALMTGCSKVDPNVVALEGDNDASTETPIQERAGFRTTLGSTDGILTSQNSNFKMKGRVSFIGGSDTGDPVLVSTNGTYKLKGTVKF